MLLALLPAILSLPNAPSRARVIRAVARPPADFCYGLPGNIAPLWDFDPLGLSCRTSKAEVFRWREAELTHGRVAMLAAGGFLVQEWFHPLFSGVGGPAIKQIPQLPPVIMFCMALGIGCTEALRIQKGWANPYESNSNLMRLKPDYYPGDLNWDPLGLKPTDPQRFRRMQEIELSHGRMAMIAAAGFMAQEALTGTTWSENNIFKILMEANGPRPSVPEVFSWQ